MRSTTERSCFSLDTNILVYAADWRAGRRHDVAVDLLGQAVGTACVLTLQSLSEFFHVTTRKGVLPVAEAMAAIDDWRALYPVVAADEAALADALTAVRDHNLSFWDAMLWATVRRAGCGLLVTEDLQHGRTLGGVRFVNPFGETMPDELAAALRPA